MSKATEPAFPTKPETFSRSMGRVEQNNYIGLTKREYFAGLAMQSLLQGSATEILLGRTGVTFSDHAVRCADALLAELGK